jgi:exodeoxyribonuclease-3
LKSLFPKQYWCFNTEKGGYSGVAILSKYDVLSYQVGFGKKNFDSQGRILTVEFDNFYLISTYVLNSGSGLKNLNQRIKKWDVEFKKYVNQLKSKKMTIVLGDLNVAHQEIDIKNPKINKKNAGFTIEERNNFQKVKRSLILSYSMMDGLTPLEI